MELPIKRRKATRQACKASIQIEGLTGTGKTGLALELAYVLADKDWDKVDTVDTENKSHDLYVGLKTTLGDKFGSFNVSDLDDEIGYKPSYYLALRKQAVEAGCKAWVADSISHAWQYNGGVLDMVSKVAPARNNDKYAAWKDPEVAKEKNNLLPLIRSNHCHVITTVRVKEKMEYVDKADGSGRKELKSLGEQQIQQGELKYEPDLVLHMLKPADTTGNIIIPPLVRVIKSRYAILKKDEEYEFTPQVYEQIRQYLTEGVDPETLLEQTRLDYVEGVKTVLDTSPTKQTLWKALKNEQGIPDVKLDEIPLDTLKKLYIQLID